MSSKRNSWWVTQSVEGGGRDLWWLGQRSWVPLHCMRMPAAYPFAGVRHHTHTHTSHCSGCLLFAQMGLSWTGPLNKKRVEAILAQTFGDRTCIMQTQFTQPFLDVAKPLHLRSSCRWRLVNNLKWHASIFFAFKGHKREMIPWTCVSNIYIYIYIYTCILTIATSEFFLRRLMRGTISSSTCSTNFEYFKFITLMTSRHGSLFSFIPLYFLTCVAFWCHTCSNFSTAFLNAPHANLDGLEAHIQLCASNAWFRDSIHISMQ